MPPPQTLPRCRPRLGEDPGKGPTGEVEASEQCSQGRIHGDSQLGSDGMKHKGSAQ